jgi:hypothetical protein
MGASILLLLGRCVPWVASGFVGILRHVEAEQARRRQAEPWP